MNSSALVGSSAHKQGQSKELITYVIHVNNKLPHKATVRISYTGEENKKEYKESVVVPGRSTLKIPLNITSKKNKIVLNLSTIESINPQTNTLVSRIPEWEFSHLSNFSLIIDPKTSLNEPLYPSTKGRRLTTIPEETNEKNHPSREDHDYSREEIIQAYCPNSTHTPRKEPSKKALPEGLPEGLESFLS
jgi:hypothetical protein